MAPMKPVEENDVFSNRRMTRSAFKQASGYLEKMSQQKELVFPIQKQDGLLEKNLSLSKADDKQQEQQQQYRDGEDVEEVRRKNREARIERNKAFLRLRKLTREEAESYSKKVTESEGFDVVDLPYDIDYTGLIRRVEQSNEADRILEECAKSAIATFNEAQKSKYRFVKVIKANYYPASGICYYITFETEDEDIGSKKFQAFVRVHFGKMYVNFCRIEEPSKEWVQSSFKYVMRDERDPNEPEMPSPASFWFLEEFRKTYLEKYPNATAGDVAKASAREWISMSGAKKTWYFKIAEEKMVEYHKDLKAYKKHKKELAEGPGGGRKI